MERDLIQHFFEGATAKMKASGSGSIMSPSPPAVIAHHDIDRFMRETCFRWMLAERLQQRMDRVVASRFSAFRYFSIDENTLSDILADLLHPSGSHGQGDCFLKLLLQRLSVDTNDLTGAVITREDSTHSSTNERRRIDITITLRGCVIGIENKPWASDQPDQVTAYLSALESRQQGTAKMAYISAHGNPPTNLHPDKASALQADGRLVLLGWSGPMQEWLSDCARHCEADRVRWFIKEFLAAVQDFFPNHGGRRDERVG